MWILTVLSWALRPFESKWRDSEKDIRAEIILRGNEPPFELVTGAFEKLLQQFERKERSDPEKFQEFCEKLEYDIKAFAYKRDKSKS
jgi:hypothetical protein